MSPTAMLVQTSPSSVLVPAGPQLPQLLLLLVGGVALSMASTGQVVQVLSA